MLTGNLEKIAEHGRRADSIVRGMLQHSRGSSGDWQATDLNALVEESLKYTGSGRTIVKTVLLTHLATS
jgi:two-component system NtrC family sensor kinase